MNISIVILQDQLNQQNEIIKIHEATGQDCRFHYEMAKDLGDAIEVLSNNSVLPSIIPTNDSEVAYCSRFNQGDYPDGICIHCGLCEDEH